MTLRLLGLDIGGANAAFSQFAGARPKNKNKPSAGIIGGSAGGAALTFTDYACGDDTPGTILKEIRRLMVQQDDVGGRKAIEGARDGAVEHGKVVGERVVGHGSILSMRR